MIEPEENKATTGLIAKFEVKRLTPSSRGIDHHQCRYFVLDPQHDDLARAALRTYAQAAQIAGQRQLALDLFEWLDSIDSPSVQVKIEELNEQIRRLQEREEL